MVHCSRSSTYAEREGFTSRSAVLHEAVRLLRASELGAAYEDAWAEWEAHGESALWEPTAADGTAQRLGRGVVTVVPVTSNTDRVYPFQVLLPARATGLPVDSKAQAEQVRSIAIERLGRRVGMLNAELQTDLDGALRLHLAL